MGSAQVASPKCPAAPSVSLHPQMHACQSNGQPIHRACCTPRAFPFQTMPDRLLLDRSLGAELTQAMSEPCSRDQTDYSWVLPAKLTYYRRGLRNFHAWHFHPTQSGLFCAHPKPTCQQGHVLRISCSARDPPTSAYEASAISMVVSAPCI